MAKRKRISQKDMRKILFILFCIVVVCMLLYRLSVEKTALPEGQLEIYFADIGQGDAALVVTEAGEVLIDAGIKETEAILYHLIAEKDTTLEYLVITHPHADHMGAATYILEMLDVENILLPADTATTASYRKFLSVVAAEGAMVQTVEEGMTFALGEAEFTCLAPLSDTGDKNENSTVLRLDFGDFSALFTGDAGEESENKQLERYGNLPGGPLDVDLLKVGHHGSRYSSTHAYLTAVTPMYAVISCGEGNSYGHPHKETLNRLQIIGAAVYRTDLLGTVAVTVTDGEVRIGK